VFIGKETATDVDCSGLILELTARNCRDGKIIFTLNYTYINILQHIKLNSLRVSLEIDTMKMKPTGCRR
jgi:hypothetical protein